MRSFIFFLVSLAIVGVGVMQFNEFGWDWNWGWYLAVIICWVLFMWIYPHWKEFQHDLGQFTGGESPFSMEWIGSIVIIGSVLLVLILAVFAGVIWLFYWLITTVSPWIGNQVTNLIG